MPQPKPLPNLSGICDAQAARDDGEVPSVMTDNGLLPMEVEIAVGRQELLEGCRLVLAIAQTLEAEKKYLTKLSGGFNRPVSMVEALRCLAILLYRYNIHPVNASTLSKCRHQSSNT